MKSGNTGRIFAGIICIIIAVGAFFAVYLQQSSWQKFKKTAVETQARITNIEKYRSGTRKHRKTHYRVTVSYVVDGVEYENLLGYYKAGMRVGNTVKVYYDPEDPSHMMTNPLVLDIVFSVLAVIFFLLGVFLALGGIKRKIMVSRLISDNKYVICDNWTEESTNYSVNNVRYHRIVCHYIDDYGDEHTFCSDAFNPRKSPFTPGQSVKVYVDMNDILKGYFVSSERE